MRRGKHPAQISLSIHASDEGAFIATPLDPPASLSLFPEEASGPKIFLRRIHAP